MARMSRLLRVAWGTILLVRPEAVLAAAGVRDPGMVPVARVLGARHLLQAAAIGPAAPPGLRRLGAATDVLHVASLAAAAALLPRRRRAAIADAGPESLITLLSLRS